MTSEKLIEKNKNNFWICEICKKKVKGVVKAMAMTGHHQTLGGNYCEGIFYPDGKESRKLGWEQEN